MKILFIQVRKKKQNYKLQNIKSKQIKSKYWLNEKKFGSKKLIITLHICSVYKLNRKTKNDVNTNQKIGKL